MSASEVERIADAVLYEGFNLYPYRPSSVKNRQRWTFGGVYPRAFCKAQAGGDAWTVGTECVAVGSEATILRVSARFLHLLTREVAELTPPISVLPPAGEAAYRIVEELRAGEQVLRGWEEASDRAIALPAVCFADLRRAPCRLPFAFPAWRALEPVADPGGTDLAGAIVRTQQPLSGELIVEVKPVDESFVGESNGAAFTLNVQLCNLTPFDAVEPDGQYRERALQQSLVSAHVILSLDGGRFISMQDPPSDLATAAAGCRNGGLWPVLVGDEATRNTLLAAPIILYDFPRIAPESPGDLFDSTEIDEILTLRILTLTDEERREAGAADERTRALLDRTDALAPEQLANLHGALRDLRRLAKESR